MESQKNHSFSLSYSLSHAALINAALAALLLSSAASAQTPNIASPSPAAPKAAQQTTVSQTVTFSASNQNCGGVSNTASYYASVSGGRSVTQSASNGWAGGSYYSP